MQMPETLQAKSMLGIQSGASNIKFQFIFYSREVTTEGKINSPN